MIAGKIILKWLLLLQVAVERETEGDFILGDMGEGMPFRAGAFDGAISIRYTDRKCGFLASHALTHIVGKLVGYIFG